MVGAKEFAMGRKTIAPKEENPLLKKMSPPPPAFKQLSGSFLDKLRSKAQAPKKVIGHASMFPDFLNILDTLSSFTMPAITPLTITDKSKEAEIPQELINHVTYLVFKNFRKYLNQDMTTDGSSSRHIKIDISL